MEGDREDPGVRPDAGLELLTRSRNPEPAARLTESPGGRLRSTPQDLTGPHVTKNSDTGGRGGSSCP